MQLINDERDIMSGESVRNGMLFLVLCAVAFLLVPIAVNGLTDSILRLSSGERWVDAVKFFLTEVPRIFLLLALVVFVIRVIRSFVSLERTMTFVRGKHPFTGNVLASFVGIITPFCSCGVVPLFIGLIQAGVPLGVSLSLLISAPMINEIALVMLLGLFGWKTALLYVGTGLVIATLSGFVVGRMGLEKYIEEWVYANRKASLKDEEVTLLLGQRFELAFAEVRTTVSKVWLYLIVGMGIGAVIHGYVPGEFMTNVMGKAHWWSVPAAVLIGIPLYLNSAGMMPIVQSLLSKGAALGTSLSFMMSVIGLSFPEIIILRRVLKMPLILTFLGVVACGIIVVGYVFNFLF